MKGTIWCCGLSCSIAACLGATAGAQTATVSLEAVQINEKDIPPTGSVEVNPGDTITAELHASDWSVSGDALRAYQIAIGVDSITGGDSGSITPLGWDNPRTDLLCTTDADCSDGLTCFFDDGRPRICAGPDHDPAQGAFIDETRTDFIFFDKSAFGGVDVINFRYAQTLAQPADCVMYDGSPRYCGTLVLEASGDALGTFTIPVPALNTWLSRCDVPLSPIEPLTREPLTITVTPAGWQVVDSDPPNCAIDARQPTPPDGDPEQGWKSIALRLGAVDTSYVTLTGFSIREDPVSTEPIEPAYLSPNDPDIGWTTVHFSRPVAAGRWTCISFVQAPEQEVCLGSLPTDVDGNTMGHPEDVQTLIDQINGLLDPPLEERQCDIDRSGQCGPSDILRVIDLLGGAEAYDAWVGQSLPACPSAPLPPQPSSTP